MRDAERTKQQIMEAAATEFAAKGFAGARVEAIAQSAGVNKQLIAYYFDGKEGLYRSVVQQKVESGPVQGRSDKPFAEIIAAIWENTLADPAPSRLLLWQALETADQSQLNPMQDDRIRATLAEIQKRQRSGELRADYDAGAIALILMASLTAPIALPQILRVVSGGTLNRAKFLKAYCGQLQRLFLAQDRE